MAKPDIFGPIPKAPERKEKGSIQELQHYVNEGEKIALRHIKNTYGFQVPDRDNILFYHGEWHTEGVVARAVKIMEVVRKADPNAVSEEDVQAAKLAAAFHDTVQNWKVDDTQTWGTSKVVMKKRQRFVRENEGASASLARQYMAKANLVAGHRIFSDDFMNQVDAAIMLTTPKGWDGQTVFHPDFAKASLIAKAVQLADLGGSGMHGSKMAIHEALTLFAEENLDFREDADRAFLGPRRGLNGGTSSEMLQQYRLRLVDWLGRQQNFVKGRKERVRGEIATLPDSVRSAVNQLFMDSNFDKSVTVLERLQQEYSLTADTSVTKKLFAAIKKAPKITW